MFHIRRTLFVIFAVFFRLPIWALIWLIGRTGIIKTIFVIYPHDAEEYRRLCPNHPLFIKLLSGRPTPGGLILDGWKPVGIYLYVSNTPQELIKKSNRPVAEAIVRRMRWIQKISGAKACGFAGQLGPILERRHGIPMEPPFFTSMHGNVFSIDDAVSHLNRQANRHPWQTKVAIVGGGELGDTLRDHFAPQGYQIEMVDILLKRRGTTELRDKSAASLQLAQADYVVNLLSTGGQFLTCGAVEYISSSATVIDFSRPQIDQDKINARVYMGNRVQRSGMRFALALPEWQKYEMPACSLPVILAANFGIIARNSWDFAMAARKVGFQTAIAPLAHSSTSIQPARVDLPTVVSSSFLQQEPAPVVVTITE